MHFIQYRALKIHTFNRAVFDRYSRKVPAIEANILQVAILKYRISKSTLLEACFNNALIESDVIEDQSHEHSIIFFDVIFAKFAFPVLSSS
jgi:hypothetical protein